MSTAIAASDPPFTAQRNELFQRNLGSLRNAQAELAERIENAALPQGLNVAVGRDGSATFRMCGADGRPVWFGGSSMPRISSEEMFGSSRADCGNVMLPGILTGREPLVVLDRIPAFRGVLVIEKEPSFLRVAFHVADYADAIAAGRLGFILDDELAEELHRFFERHPGWELPTQMFTVPQRSSAEIADLQRRVEQAGEAVWRMQARAVEAHTRTIARRKRGVPPDSPRTALLSTDPSPATADQVRRIERGLTALGWPFATCIPDSPARCHTLARIQTVDRIEADWIIVVNAAPGGLRTLAPSVPIVSWYGPDAVPTPPPGALGPRELLCVSSLRARDSLVRAGVREDAVHILPPAGDALFRDSRSFANQPKVLDVAVLLDVPDDGAEAAGLTLPSHVSLWTRLVGDVQHLGESCLAAKPEDVLGQAERASGVSLSQANDRAHFLRLLGSRILPRAAAVATVGVLRQAGVRFGCWGANWASIAGPEAQRGTMPASEGPASVFRLARAILLPSLSGTAVQTALDALLADVDVVLRASPDEILNEYPTAPEALAGVRLYRTPAQLRAAMQANRGVEVSCSVRERHTMTARLRAGLRLVQDRA